jgi:hypothetical protein
MITPLQIWRLAVHDKSFPVNDDTALCLLAIREATILVAKSENGDDRSPVLRGRCVEVALTVRAVLGGEVVGAFVPCSCEPGCEGTNHYWNVLPDGRAYDLTSDQFGGDGMSVHFRGDTMDVPLTRTFEVMGFVSKILDGLAMSATLVPL